MKSIKPIALKEAKVLSNEEMKHLFGGSAADSRITTVCHENDKCTITDYGISYSGKCRAVLSESSLDCYCVFSGGGVIYSGASEKCFNIMP